MMSEPPKRQRLANVTTFENVVDLIRSSSNIIVLTGAGVSVSCGIPDFRSRDGIYSRLAQDFPDLPDPQVSSKYKSDFTLNKFIFYHCRLCLIYNIFHMTLDHFSNLHVKFILVCLNPVLATGL